MHFHFLNRFLWMIPHVQAKPRPGRGPPIHSTDEDLFEPMECICLGYLGSRENQLDQGTLHRLYREFHVDACEASASQLVYTKQWRRWWY